MSLTLGLNAAISGLSTAQKGLDLVSHNISNVNTEGHTRKIFNPESRVLAGSGAGVQVGSVTREVDQGLLDDLREEASSLYRFKTLDEYYNFMQDMFGETGSNTSISHVLTTLGEEWEALGVSPNSATAQATAVDAAVRAIDKLNDMSDSIQDLRLRADQELESAITRVNALLDDISSLNDKIVRSTALEQTGTADLEDKRDLALQELSQYMDITTFERENGATVVYSNGGSALVDSTANHLTHSALTSISAWQTKAGGDIANITVASQDVTADFGSGKIYGLIELRDEILPNLQSEVDRLADSLKTEVNAIHNRGTNYPEMMHTYNGTRQFLDSANQTVTMTGDVTLLITDTAGTQVATTTLDTVMQTAGYGSGAQASGGPWDIDEIAASIEDWLQDANGGNLATASVSINSDGKMDIVLGDTSYSLNFRDETATAANSTASDVTMSFDSDGDGTVDESIDGFSNFFGLNDFFTSARKNWAWDSDIFGEHASVGAAGTLNFSDETNGLAFDSITVNANDTLQDIADRINDDAALSAVVTAEIIPEGTGYRLRLSHVDGEELVVTQAGGTALVGSLGLNRSPVAQAEFVSVRDDIVANPQLVSRGQVQYSTDLAEYYVSAGDNTNANDLADLFTETVGFEQAGGLSATNRTFAGYADAILGLNSTDASNLEIQLEYQDGLVTSLQTKRAEISDVNLDEELAQLMIYEQSYAAAGKVIQTVSNMLDILNSLIQ